MQWSGPNIQLQSCHYNKNGKKLNYLVKPHESVPYDFLFVVMAFFGKNPICKTVEVSFLKELLCLMFTLFFTKNLYSKKFYMLFFKYSLMGFVFDSCWHTKKRKKDLISTFDNTCFSVFCFWFFLDKRYFWRSAIWRRIPKENN